MTCRRGCGWSGRLTGRCSRSLAASTSARWSSTRYSSCTAPSPSRRRAWQAKQLALRLCARGIAVRRGAFGRTELTDAGRDLALEAEARLEDVVAGRMAGMDPTLRVLGGATLADMTLPSLA